MANPPRKGLPASLGGVGAGSNPANSNEVLIAQAKETWLSNALSINVLVGLGLNAVFGWAWADPLVALVVAGFAAYAGVDAWREASEDKR